MKNVLIFVFVASALLLVSCKKEYICECTITQNLDGEISVSTMKSTIYSSNEKKARSECETESYQNLGGFGMNVSQTAVCVLK